MTWDASLLGTADGSLVELRVVGHASGGNPSNRRTVEVGAVEWNALLEAPPATPDELYFLRARYYDPETGRFIGRDPIQFDQRYAYATNNPVLYIDPSGSISCGKCRGALEKVSAVATTVGAVAGAATVGCQVAAIATAGTAEFACGAIATVAVTADFVALGADVTLRFTGDDISNGQLVRDALSAGVGLSGAGLGSVGWLSRTFPEVEAFSEGGRLARLSSAWDWGGVVAAYAYTVPLDIVNATLAAESLFSSQPAKVTHFASPSPSAGQSRLVGSKE